MTPAQVVSLACPHCGASVDLCRAPLTDGIDCPSCGGRFPNAAHRFCPLCATALSETADEDRTRPACPSCGYVLYRNPLPGVAAVVVQDGAILLVRRRSSQFDGMWCMPCGYVEADEDVRDAARRECFEETGLEVEVGDVVCVRSSFEVAHRPVVGTWFRCEVTGGTLCAGDGARDAGVGAREARFFPLDAPPSDMAFDGDRHVIDLLRRERA